MDSKKISEWFFQYNKEIYHFLLYYIGSSRDIEDLVQEVFIRAIKSYDMFQGKSSPKTWLFSIARHVGIDEIRKRKKSKIKSFIGLREYELLDESTPDKALELDEKNKNLYNAIQALKGNYRDVIILRGIKELSVSETATILKWTENQVRLTFHRALKKLKVEKEVLLHEKEGTAGRNS